jgi:hypothetical protein
MTPFEMGRIPSFSERYTNAVIDKIRTMEDNLGPDQELRIFCNTAEGKVRVYRLQMTDQDVIVVHGLDEDDNPTYLISTSNVLELTCKMVKAQPNSPKTRIGFDVPPKP